MTKKTSRRACGALLAGIALLGACGGGGEPVPLTFTVTGISPAFSTDLSGTDEVTITGTNFQAAGIAVVKFGDSPGTNLDVKNDTTLTVLTPPAPGDVPGTVDVWVISVNAGEEVLGSSYTYIDSSGPPIPQTISPTTFTPTGAEDFTIHGSRLGPGGGTVQVDFVGVGTTTGTVSVDGTIIAARAPLGSALPTAAQVTVRVVNAEGSAEVPTPVSFGWSAPVGVVVSYQTLLGASTPVRLSADSAVLCTAGGSLDTVWGTADDEVVIVRSPLNATPVTRIVVGHLDAANSVPAVLDADTVCLYSPGLDGISMTGDEAIIQITNAQTAPTITRHPWAFLNTAPITAVSSNRIAFTWAGSDSLQVTANDEMSVWTFTGTNRTQNPNPIKPGYLHAIPGPGNFSIPIAGDSDTIYILSVGPGGVSGDTNDTLFRYRVSTDTLSAPVEARHLIGRPTPLGPNLLVVPAGSRTTPPGGVGDRLVTFQSSGGGLSWSEANFSQAMQLTTPLVYTPAGSSGVAVVLSGNVVRVYTDPVTDEKVDLPFGARPLLAAFGLGDLLIVTTAGARWVAGDGTDSQNFSVSPVWGLGVTAATDNDRAFAIDAGADGTAGTGDERLVVYQTRTLGAAVDAVAIPLATSANFPVTGAEAFYPIGPDWGLIQSPGFSGIFGTIDDHIILARY